MNAVRLLALLCGLVASACSRSSYDAKGAATPTVAGTGAAAYAGLDEARRAFSRSDGPMTAILLDAAWIRLEPDPATAEERYPGYFEGYTSFDVTLETQQFARPTEEAYLLEDSTGKSVTAKPTRYKGDFQRGFGPKFAATFQLVFPHVLAKDVRWIRLSRRTGEKGTMTWDFPGGG
jgi:hypothetical protein